MGFLKGRSRGRRGRSTRDDRGAAAVEMALVLPLLLFVLMALIDFGRAYNAQIQLSAAAREGVRLASLNGTADPALPIVDNPTGTLAIAARVTSAAGGMAPPAFIGGPAGACPDSPNSVCITYCPTAADEASVVVTSSFTWITGISAMSKLLPGSGSGTFTTPDHITTTGVMRCAG